MNFLDARKRTEDAVKQVEKHANQEWKDCAFKSLIEVASNKKRFTVDHVWPVLKKYPVETHSLRAMGAIMRQAEKEGYIKRTNEFDTGNRNMEGRSVTTHICPIRIWESLIYKEG